MFARFGAALQLKFEQPGFSQVFQCWLCVSLISGSAWPEFVPTFIDLYRSAFSISEDSEGEYEDGGLDRNMAATHSASLCSIVSDWLRVKREAKGSAEEASRAVSVLQLGAWNTAPETFSQSMDVETYRSMCFLVLHLKLTYCIQRHDTFYVSNRITVRFDAGKPQLELWMQDVFSFDCQELRNHKKSRILRDTARNNLRNLSARHVCFRC